MDRRGDALRPLPGLKRSGTLFVASLLLTLVADQLTKALFWRAPSAGAEPTVIIPHVLSFVPHEGNPRGAMGLGPENPVFYAVAACVGLVVIVVWLATTPAAKWHVHIALGLLAGGALGNLIDRVAIGKVRDFIDLHWGDAFHWHTFNVADAALCIGFAIVAYEAFLGGEQGDSEHSAEAEEVPQAVGDTSPD